MNNAYFGKTMENVKLRKNIELVSNARTFLKLIAKPQLESFKILNENTIIVNRVKETVVLDKPIYMQVFVYWTCLKFSCMSFTTMLL